MKEMSQKAKTLSMVNKLQQALDLCNKKDFEKATNLLEEIIKDEPQNSEAWRVLAQIHWINNKSE